ncbi:MULTISPECIES: hypothetical protein [Ferrimonas]|uniref:hypothetical protein n=1 Tax=Ferrimonas TaxID=44011 RepID=UPI0012EB89C8|nr:MULTISPECIES: hypothetical protein [Ferrimonas]USD38911.1 hypothetical protein J8Z22_07360 [Ferrimonas sp. SCSIO 43195]
MDTISADKNCPDLKSPANTLPLVRFNDFAVGMFLLSTSFSFSEKNSTDAGEIDSALDTSRLNLATSTTFIGDSVALSFGAGVINIPSREKMVNSTTPNIIKKINNLVMASTKKEGWPPLCSYSIFGSAAGRLIE